MKEYHFEAISSINCFHIPVLTMLATWQIGGVFKLVSFCHCPDGNFAESCQLWNYPQVKCLVGEMTIMNNFSFNITSVYLKNACAITAFLFSTFRGGNRCCASSGCKNWVVAITFILLKSLEIQTHTVGRKVESSRRDGQSNTGDFRIIVLLMLVNLSYTHSEKLAHLRWLPTVLTVRTPEEGWRAKNELLVSTLG